MPSTAITHCNRSRIHAYQQHYLAAVQDEELITFFNENCTKLGIQDPVDAVRVVRDSASQLGKGFGFVQFSDQAAARAALGCDGQPLRQRPIRVTRAVKVPAHLRDMGKAKPGKVSTGKGSMGRDVSERKSSAGGWGSADCCTSWWGVYCSTAVL